MSGEEFKEAQKTDETLDGVRETLALAETACHGGETACHGGETACCGGETACHGRETACHGRETACHGGETACHGEETACHEREFACHGGETAKLEQCQMGMRRCAYLGYVVGGGEVRPQGDKIEAVKRCEVPRTKRDVRVFLGLSGYYRCFITHYSVIAAVLTDLTRKDRPA